jgi:hypothetical protein
MESLTPEELQAFKSASENFRNIEVDLARCTADLSFLQNKKEALIVNYENLRNERDNVHMDLTEKYGEGFVINMETGEIIRQDEHNS